MDDFLLELFKYRSKLEQIKRNISKRNGSGGGGWLEICNIKGKPRYYYCTFDTKAGKTVRHYISKDDIRLAEMLAQAGYDRKVAKTVEKQLGVIDAFIKGFDPLAVRTIRDKMNPERKKLVMPEELSDEEFAKEWSSVEYAGGEFREGAPVIITNRGERVRSKSERDIANYYFEMGIPYRFEYPKVMGNGHIWHPDFLVLNVRTRKEYIHEHLGMLDDPQYVNDSLWKIEQYIKDGYFPGDRLFFTTETSQRPFDVRSLEPFVKKYLL